MGSVTAQMLFGSGHLYHGGINPTHALFLHENDRPAWSVLPIAPPPLELQSGAFLKNLLWIPTVENMLEDGLLMGAIHILRDPGVRSMAKNSFLKDLNGNMMLYDDIEEDKRNVLYEKCRSIKGNSKVILSVFKGSSISTHLPVLELYKMNVEVCVPRLPR